MKKNSSSEAKVTPSTIHAVGRRKRAVARVRLYPVGSKKEITIGGTVFPAGQIVVNDKPIEQFFSQQWHKVLYLQPLELSGAEKQFVVTIRVSGGGSAGQLEAVIHGISRALQKHDVKHHAILRKHGLLTRDSRVRQRRMVGMGGKSRRKKQSPKR